MVFAQLPVPTQRTALRLRMGKAYYRLRRYITWQRFAKFYAKPEPNMLLGHVCIQHQSLLLRPLASVQMQLQHNKVKNLQLAIEKLNHTVIYPGQVFSLWFLVGKPTRKKGYLDGLMLQQGQILSGVGGGLCQLGNLIYWMLLHTPLTITERWRHGYDVFPDVNRTIPFGCGATLSYNYIDLQAVNHTNQPFQLHLWLNETHLCGSICSLHPLEHRYQVEESDHRIEVQWWGAYTRHNKIWKVATHVQTGQQHREMVAENHAIMRYQPLLPENRKSP